ncbi:hypothetical protein [Streptomyces qinzhouensis]|uniref:Uncharacterized protein n=1 Tax=Streptomyces qinzhouensis TaxID=2599401 RepID=A0A5B8IL16_9ACTN|nr:hypothetical protein [Streptomyces qinzhouensis]QDY78159.1 hypothetical protein FQU76_18560 [Streptomyces qinzhouensis]
MPPHTLDRVRGALDLLAAWETTTTVADGAAAARDIGALLWRELTLRCLWDALPARDHAAVSWLVAHGFQVSRACVTQGKTERVAGEIIELIGEAAYWARICDTGTASRWPEAPPRRSQYGRAAQQLWQRYQALPHPWKIRIMREMEPPPGPSRTRRRLLFATFLTHAEKTPVPTTSTADQPADALVRSLSRRPAGWQIEIIRRIAAGAGPYRTSSAADEAIQIVSRQGVRLIQRPSLPRIPRS